MSIPRMETIKKTAELFNLPEYFVRQKVSCGEVVAVKAGKKYLVNVDRFADYLNNTTVQQERTETIITPVPVKL